MSRRFVPAIRAGRHIQLVFAIFGVCSIAAAAPDGESAPKPTFTINEFRVLGNTVLTEAQIDAVLYAKLGQNKTIEDVETAKIALENFYHSHGFGTVFVDIPEQTVETDGVVRLQVTEGKLSRVTVHGQRYTSARQLRSDIPEAVRGAVPNLPNLQEQITSANTVTSDRVIVPVLKAGSKPGTVDLALNVQDSFPLHGSVEVNNQYSPDTEPLRGAVALRYDNLFGRFDSLSAQYQTSIQDLDQVKVWAAGYAARLNDENDKLAFTFIKSNSAIATIGGFNVAGAGKVYSGRFVHGLSSDSGILAQLSVGFDYKDFSQDVAVGSDGSLSSPVSYTSFDAGFTASLREHTRLWSWSTVIAVGIPGLGDSRQEFADKCAGCKPNFVALRLDGGLRQELPGGFAGILQLGGQYTPDPIVSNEQFLLGGVRTVRGYLEAENVGDVGVHGTVELHAPNFIPERWIVRFMPFAFFDAGRATFVEPLPGQPSTSRLGAYGAGFEISARQWFYGSLTWSDPIRDGTRTRSGDSRWEFIVRSSW